MESAESSRRDSQRSPLTGEWGGSRDFFPNIANQARSSRLSDEKVTISMSLYYPRIYPLFVNADLLCERARIAFGYENR